MKKIYLDVKVVANNEVRNVAFAQGINRTINLNNVEKILAIMKVDVYKRQVLVDLKLFTRAELKEVAEEVEQLFHVLISQSNTYKDCLLYTSFLDAFAGYLGIRVYAAYYDFGDSLLYNQVGAGRGLSLIHI